jgi:flagellar assembly protein FliH
MEYSESGEGAPAKRDDAADALPQLKPDPEALYATRLEADTAKVVAQCKAEAAREAQRVRSVVSQAVAEFVHERQDYFQRAESEVVQLAVAIARRIIHRETQVDPMLLASVVRYELQQLDAGTEVRLLVPPASLGRWQEAVAEMAQTVAVEADKTLVGDAVRIETALGSRAVDFEGELKEIERGFFDLLSLRSAPDPTGPTLVQ